MLRLNGDARISVGRLYVVRHALEYVVNGAYTVMTIGSLEYALGLSNSSV